MEKRIHLYVSRKHPALWLTGLLMLASVVARIAVFSQVGVWRFGGGWYGLRLPLFCLF